MVIQTLPGSANSIASILDHFEFKGKLGTVAGDDTILIILRSEEEFPAFMEYLDEVF